MKKYVLLFLLIVTIISGSSFAYDNKATHKRLTEKAAEKFNLKQYLQNAFILPDDITYIDVLTWVKQGAYLEDEPNCRASNHFHNPIIPDWRDSGVKDTPALIKGWCALGDYPASETTSSIYWGTRYYGPGSKASGTPNTHDWDTARERFYIAMTGKNFAGVRIWRSNSSDEKKEALRLFFTDVGYVLHLLQDMAVPAHVRSDFMSHMQWMGINGWDPRKWVIEQYEYYVKQHDKSIFGAIDPTKPYDPEDPSTVPDTKLTNPAVWKFWDTDTYQGSGTTPEELRSMDFNNIGLAEFTNLNFASRNTILTNTLEPVDNYYQPYPGPDDTNIYTYLDDLPLMVTDKAGIPANIQYVKKYGPDSGGYGVPVSCFMIPTYLSEYVLKRYRLGSDPELYTIYLRTFIIDNSCAAEYARILIPKAISYSAALLDYFFRGDMGLAADDNGCHIINNLDEFIEGTFELFYDNVDDERVPVKNVDQYPWRYTTGIPAYGESGGMPFFALPQDARTPGEFFLVMKGGMGNEISNAVAASKITVPIIELSLPTEGVYAITDRHPYYEDTSDPRYVSDPSQYGFNKIVVNAKNISQAGEMAGGTVALQVQYRLGQADQFVYPPGATSNNTFYRIVAEKSGVTIPSSAPARLEFDLPRDLPLWATDVHLFLVYNGVVGTQSDVLCLGYKDISEPTPVDIVNRMDKICLNNTLYDAGSAEAVNVADANVDVYAHGLRDFSLWIGGGKYTTPFIDAGDVARLVFFLGDYTRSTHVSILTYPVKLQSDDRFNHNIDYHGAGYIGGSKNQWVYYQDSQLCQTSPCWIRWAPMFYSYNGFYAQRNFLFTNEPYPSGSKCAYED